MIAGYYRSSGRTEDGQIPESKLAQTGRLELLPEISGIPAPA